MSAPKIYTNAGTYAALPPRSVLLYGHQKVGKTTAAAGWPNALVLNFTLENGTVEITDRAIVDYTTLADVQQVLAWFKGGAHEHQTLVWDGFTNFVLDMAQKAQASQTYKDPRRAFGKITGEVLPVLADFLNLRKYHRIITGHARLDTEPVDVAGDKEGQTWNQVPLRSIYPDLPPRVRQWLLGMLDAYGYCYRTPKGERRARWKPIDPGLTEKFSRKPAELKSLEAGTRLPLPDTTILSFQAIQEAVVKATAPQREDTHGRNQSTHPPQGRPEAPRIDTRRSPPPARTGADS